jgi:hypothetical protein
VSRAAVRVCVRLLGANEAQASAYPSTWFKVQTANIISSISKSSQLDVKIIQGDLSQLSNSVAVLGIDV